MTQEIKLKLEQALADKLTNYIKQRHDQSRCVGYSDGVLAGAQTILENPGEWGLVPKAQHDHYMAKYTSLVEWYDKLMGTPCEQVRHQQEIESLQAQNDRYREALERIANEDDEPLGDVGIVEAKWIAKEALKQDVTSCPKCGYPLFKHLSKTCCQGCDYVKQQ